jgi:hypothetical protein
LPSTITNFTPIASNLTSVQASAHQLKHLHPHSLILPHAPCSLIRQRGVARNENRFALFDVYLATAMHSERRMVERGLAAFAFLAPIAFYDRLRFFESTAVARLAPPRRHSPLIYAHSCIWYFVIIGHCE